MVAKHLKLSVDAVFQRVLVKSNQEGQVWGELLKTWCDKDQDASWEKLATAVENIPEKGVSISQIVREQSGAGAHICNLYLGQAKIIFPVSQTSLGFSTIQAGGYFYYPQWILLNTMSSYRSNVCNRLCYVFAVGRSFDNPCPMLVAGTVGDRNPANKRTKPIFFPANNTFRGFGILFHVDCMLQNADITSGKKI